MPSSARISAPSCAGPRTAAPRCRTRSTAISHCCRRSSAGASSANNALFRKWGIKQHTNADMRADFIGRARALVEDHLHLKLPEVREAA